ncbi:MAG: hypothetical protein HYV09_06455 [Deltaproteobacteria bacterium]|nr:hypothetical protein [Deltaproteobacteria bacterium]
MANAIPHDAAIPGATPRTVDDLLALDVPTLERLYRAATTPAIEDLRGDLIGRMLPSPVANAPVTDAMRALARFRMFPWKGKTFAPRAAQRGEGWNRVFSDKNLWFRFTTSIGPSRAGAFDALQLDYDHPENPFFIRAIKDEVRTVAPGLWLGQAWVVTPKGAWLALYFALQRP